MSAFEEQKLCDVKDVNTDKPTDVYHIYPGLGFTQGGSVHLTVENTDTQRFITQVSYSYFYWTVIGQFQ